MWEGRRATFSFPKSLERKGGCCGLSVWGRGPWIGGPAGAASLQTAWWQWAAMEFPGLATEAKGVRNLEGHHLGLTLSVEMTVLSSHP